MSLLSRRSAVVLFFVISGVPIALLIYWSIAISTDSAVSQAEKGAADSAQASAVYIHERFADTASQLDFFAQRSLGPIMAAGPAHYDMTAVGGQLGELIRLQGGLDTAFVTDLRGRLVAIAPQRADLLGLYFTGDDWYEGISTQDTPYVAGLSATAARQDLNSVAIAIAIHSGSGASVSRVGYLVGLYSLDAVQGFVDNFASTRHTNICVIDSQGYVLAAPDLQPGTVTSWPADDRMLAGALAGRNGQSTFVRDGSVHLAAYASVPSFRWAVVADVPSAVALAGAEQLRQKVLSIGVVLGVVLIIGLVVGWTLVHRAQQSAALQQRMVSLARLNEAARSVHAERGALALQIIVTSARELVEADFCALGVWRPEAMSTEPVAHDASPELVGAELRELSMLLVESRQPVVTTGQGALAQLLGSEQEAELWGLGPFLSVPLTAGQRVLGCLVVCRRDGAGEFDALNESQLIQMAQHATSVLEKARHDGEREAFLDRLRETNAELEQANRLKSQFLARMSHELRTPLSAIIGFSDLLLEGTSGELTPAQREDVGEISSAGRVLLDVINDILDLSRIEAGRMPLALEPTRLSALLTEVASALRPLARQKGLDLRVAIVGEDPPVMADPLRVRQVVTNLVSNALKFTPTGGVAIRLVTLPGDEVEVSVLDTGIGIPAPAVDTVFDEFSQVEGMVGRGFSGSGLGLSIARRLVHLHQGSIGVESELGVGSRFWFRLPVAPGAARRMLGALPMEGVAR
ncbi:MAG TPA: ATP-binding protein [Candidatus Dormibacteraeota bacterium]|nr:ATP-binding protein [Candidatus Dormibacteraeota bacterium]